MGNRERNPKHHPLDTGAVVQLITGIKEQSPALQISYGTDRTIDRDRLKYAVKKALGLFCVFRVKLELSPEDRKPVYVDNNADVDVYPFDGKQHSFGKESNGYLFRVYYRENTVILSLHHALTDIFGANEFLKCILSFYFDVGYEPAVDGDDFRDPYSMYGSTGFTDFSMKFKWHNELIIPNGMKYRKGEPITVHELVFPISGFLKIAKKAESSVFPLLAWLMSNAVTRTYNGEDRLVTGAGSSNCRRLFGSRTPRNFSQTFLTVLNPDERKMDLDSQLTVQRVRMDMELEEGTVNNSLALRRNVAGIMAADPEKYILDQETLDAERHMAASKSTYFISYPGHIDPGAGLEKHIRDIRILGTVTRVPIVAYAYEWQGLLHIMTQEIGCRNSIAPALMEIAGELGINGEMADTFLNVLDDFPLQELYHD